MNVDDLRGLAQPDQRTCGPSSLVAASRESPVATLVAVTLASLMTAPLGAVTVPVMVPLFD